MKKILLFSLFIYLIFSLWKKVISVYTLNLSYADNLSSFVPYKNQISREIIFIFKLCNTDLDTEHFSLLAELEVLFI